MFYRVVTQSRTKCEIRNRANMITHSCNMVYTFYVGEIEWREERKSLGQEMLTAVKK